jgi:hypothetical protein
MRTHSNFVYVVLISICILPPFSSAKDIEVNDKTLNCVTGSNIGMNILRNFKRAVVARFENGDEHLFGLSSNPDGKRIKEFKKLTSDDISGLVNLFLDEENFSIDFGKAKNNYDIDNGKKLNWNQGFEISDNMGFVRIYFTQDGRECKFFTSSGVESACYVCSEKLAMVAKALLGKIPN